MSGQIVGSSSSRRALLIRCYGGTAVALVWCVLALRFYRAFVSDQAWAMSDDVYISASAARSLAEGYGPVWYPGAPRVEGFSNPLWVGVLALLHLLPGATDDRLGGFVLGVNLALLCALAAACVRLVAGATESERIDRAGGAAGPSPGASQPHLEQRAIILLALLAPAAMALAYFASEGFEVVLLALLGVLTLDAAWRGQPVRFALLVGLGFWTRMDFVVMAALPAVLLLSRRRLDASLLGGAGVGAAMVALLLVGRRLWFGSWLPNTWYLKGTGWPLLDRLSHGAAQNAWAWPSALVALALLLAIGWWQRSGRFRGPLLPGTVAGATFVLGLLYSTWVGGDFLGRRAGWDRFAAPFLPLLVVAVALALSAATLEARRARATIVAIAVLIGLLAPAVATDADRRVLQRRLLDGAGRSQPRAWSLRWRRYGLAYREISLPGARMAVCAAGSVVYFSHRGGVDLLGKMDPLIARLAVGPEPEPSRCWRDWPGHNKEDVVGSFERDRPDFSSVEPPAEARSDYRRVRHRALDFWVLRESPYVRWDRVSPDARAASERRPCSSDDSSQTARGWPRASFRCRPCACSFRCRLRTW